MIDISGTLVVFNINFRDLSNLQGSIIEFLPKFSQRLISMHWIQYSDLLAIQFRKKIIIWDYILGKELRSIEYFGEVKTMANYPLGYLIVRNRLPPILIKQDETSEEIVQLENQLRLDAKGIVWLRKQLSLTQAGVELIPKNRSISRNSKRIKKIIQDQNEIKLQTDILYNSKEKYPLEILVAKQFHHLLKQTTDLGVEYFHGAVSLIGLNFSIVVIQVENEAKSISFNSSDFQFVRFIEATSEYIVKIENKFKFLQIRNGQIIPLDLQEFFLDANLRLSNLPNYFQIDTSGDLQSSFQHFKHGFLCFPDLDDKYLFYDLLTNDSKQLSDFDINSDSEVYVNVSGKYLVLWTPEAKFPLGKLWAYDLKTSKTDKGKLIYDLNTSILDAKTDEQPSNPFVIPKWSSVNLNLFYKDVISSIKLSLSGIYLTLDAISKSQHIQDMEFFKPKLSKTTFIKFGDIEIQIEDSKFLLKGVSPIFEI
ncbi:MAG: hypothetical protein IH840_14120, partial [Candidatus Heimdallarchaeota archaeon]|nr:hypothetical protein [Candidatus Heimdallarchaeota archaeon]